jgi:hypothetical protein
MPVSLFIAFILFAAMGAGLIWKPEYVSRLTGVELTTVESRNEVRAVYGGFGVAMAIAMFIAMVSTGLRGGIMVTTGLALIGMAAGRGYSIWLERPANNLIYAFLGLEAVIGLMVFFRV